MKKGGDKPKASRKRKVIEIKQSKQISPVKQVFEPEDSRGLSKTQKANKIIVPALPKMQSELHPHQLQAMSTLSDALVPSELMRNIVAKQFDQIKVFLEVCPLSVQKAFEKAIKFNQENLNLIREERIQRMKEDTVIFVPPDKDHFQKHKGKTLNNWIKGCMQTHQQKQKMGDFMRQNYSQAVKCIEYNIYKLSRQVPASKIEPDLQKMVQIHTQNDNNQIKKRLQHARGCLLDILQTTNQIRLLKQEQTLSQLKQEFQIQLQSQCKRIQLNPTHSMMLLAIEDYF